MEMKGWETAAFLQKRNVWLMVVQCRPASPLLQLGQRGTSWGRLGSFGHMTREAQPRSFWFSFTPLLIGTIHSRPGEASLCGAADSSPGTERNLRSAQPLTSWPPRRPPAPCLGSRSCFPPGGEEPTV